MPISSYAGGVRPTRRSIWRPTPYAPHHPESQAYAPGLSGGLRPRMSWYGLSGGLRPGISCEADPPLSAPDDLVVRHLVPDRVPGSVQKRVAVLVEKIELHQVVPTQAVDRFQGGDPPSHVRENALELALREKVVRLPTRVRITVAELENALALMVFEHAGG